MADRSTGDSVTKAESFRAKGLSSTAFAPPVLIIFEVPLWLVGLPNMQNCTPKLMQISSVRLSYDTLPQNQKILDRGGHPLPMKRQRKRPGKPDAPRLVRMIPPLRSCIRSKAGCRQPSCATNMGLAPRRSSYRGSFSISCSFFASLEHLPSPPHDNKTDHHQGA
jgi:hypothetical protein